MSRIRGFASGFTLVELLVVIGIIAILISILLPVLTSARRQGMKVKCAAQMRDVGAAMVIYAQENKGYLPTPALGNAYIIDGITYAKGPAEAYNSVVHEYVKWWCFLAHYLTKNKPMAQNADEMASEMRGTFWCPAFPGYQSGSGNPSDVQGGINRNLTGVGMNWWPSAGPTNPAAGLDFPAANEKFANATSANNPGKWYKLVQYSRPAERALLGDSRQFYLEAKSVPSSDAIPGQRLIVASNDYSSGVTGQAMFDFYRHGTYPPVANGDQLNGYFSPKGGKIGYNILFADNHVESATDREAGYRACRMRFPN